MAATRPSIMSEGATTSAPAAAWLKAVRTSGARDASLTTSPASTIPQCPWSVYAHRHTSVMTTRSSPKVLFSRPTACCTAPSGAQAALPSGVL